jgi:hypothetical protein
MKNYIKTIAIVAATSTITFLLFQKVLANKNDIKINPAVEVINKHGSTVQNGTFCPRTVLGEMYDKQSASEEIYFHCKSCEIGAFLLQKDGSTRCSYCSIDKNESVSAR